MSLTSARAAHKAKPKIKKTPKVPLPTPKPQPGTKKGRGRPSAYSPEIAERLCERIAMREPLSKITCDDDMPCESTIYKWRAHYPEFAEKVARAREHRALARADYMDEVVDDVRFGGWTHRPAGWFWRASAGRPAKRCPRSSATKSAPT